MARTLATRPPRLPLPRWARPEHPIVRQEARRLRRARWPRLQLGGWPAAAGLFALTLLPAACVAAIFPRPQMRTADWIVVVGSTLVVTAIAASALLNWLTGLAATISGAALIAQEREEQRWTFLRVTTLGSGEIVGGKLAALLSALLGRMHLAAGLRLFALGAAGGTLALAAAVSRAPLTGALDMLLGLFDSAPARWLLAASVGGANVAAGLAYWLIEPYFSALYNAVVGLTASTLARTRGTAIALAFAAHLVLALGVYWPAQQAAYLLLALPEGAGGLLTGLALGLALQFALFVGLQIAVMAGGLIWSVQRVERLGD